MTSAIGQTPHLVTLRQVPMPGEVGHLGTCPLCSHAKNAPPCLACRDELRARLSEMNTVVMIERALN